MSEMERNWHERVPYMVKKKSFAGGKVLSFKTGKLLANIYN
jgi:hypothetical protein